jgi:RNA polymerase sigma-70 factor, ECF subfamily
VNTDDRRLIDLSRQGDTSAFGELVLRYQDRLYNSLIRLLDHPDDTLDVVQEAFLNAYQSLHHFKGDSEFFTWLYRIAFNAAISQKRKRRVRLTSEYTDEDGLEPADQSIGSQPGDLIERTEEEWKLNQGIARLSPEHRSVLILKDIEGMKYEEMAIALDVPIGTIRSRLHRARLELRDILEQTWPGEWDEFTQS